MDAERYSKGKGTDNAEDPAEKQRVRRADNFCQPSAEQAAYRRHAHE